MKELARIRKQLAQTAEWEPENARQFIATLDRQLQGWAKDSSNHEALRPEIEKTIVRIERARSI